MCMYQTDQAKVIYLYVRSTCMVHQLKWLEPIALTPTSYQRPPKMRLFLSRKGFSTISAWHLNFRANNIALIIADTAGLYAQIFNDFGAKFYVNDVTGEEPLSSLISVVTQDGLVATLDDVRHGFEDGDSIIFSEVEGMTELNGTTHKIKVRPLRINHK